MTFDYFLETSKIIEKFVSEFLVDHRHNFIAKRRQLTADSLENGQIVKDIGRDASCREHFAFENDAKIICVGAVYSHAGITEECYVKTTATYLVVDPTKKAFFENEIEKIQAKYRKTIVPELSRDSIPQHIS